MASPFPPEIEFEILLNLPAKSLQRFTSVSKSWHSLITSSSFITTFNHRVTLRPQHFLLLKHPYSTSPIHFSLSSPFFIESSSFLKPPQDENEDDNLHPTRVELVSSDSINGVLCVLVYMGLSNWLDVTCDLFLWNPSTGESFKVPSSKITGLFSGPPMVKFYLGFGFCSDDDYKVVRVVYKNSVRGTAEVYSLRNNGWKILQLISCSGISSNILWANSTCTFVDGVGYWGVYKKERKDKFSVLGFDFEGECFKKVKVPVECVDGGEMRYHSMWVYRGMLAVSVLRFGKFESGFTRHCIWVRMADGGLDYREKHWCRLFDIDLEGGPRKPMASLGSGEVLLLEEFDGEHVLYDPENEEEKRVDIFDVDAVVSHVESLVSFRQIMPAAQDSVLEPVVDWVL